MKCIMIWFASCPLILSAMQEDTIKPISTILITTALKNECTQSPIFRREIRFIPIVSKDNASTTYECAETPESIAPNSEKLLKLNYLFGMSLLNITNEEALITFSVKRATGVRYTYSNIISVPLDTEHSEAFPCLDDDMSMINVLLTLKTSTQ